MVYQWFLAFGGVFLFLFLTIQEQNLLMLLKREVPRKQEVLRHFIEENRRLDYELERLCCPSYLLELLRMPEYSHLKFPEEDSVVVVELEP